MLGKRQFVAAALGVVSVAGFIVLATSTDGAAAAPSGSTVRGSVNDNGTEITDGGGSSQISGNGRFQIFITDTDLGIGPGTTCTCGSGGSTQKNVGVYVRDLQSGHTNLVSFGKDGNNNVIPETGDSLQPSISDDGRLVSFVTDAHNIVPVASGTTTPVRVVCDRGAPDSASGDFTQVPGSGSYAASKFTCYSLGLVQDPSPFDNALYPHLSGNGTRYVYSDSFSSQRQVYQTPLNYSPVYGLQSTPGAGVEVNFDGGYYVNGLPSDVERAADEPQISDNGRWLVAAVQGGATTTDYAIMEADLGHTPVIAQRVDLATKGTPNIFIGSTSVQPGHPVVSGNGSVVLFDDSHGEGTVEDQQPSVYATQVDTSATGFDTTPADAQTSPASASLVISTQTDGTTPGVGKWPAISADGIYVSFVTDLPGMYPDSGEGSSGGSCIATVYGGPSRTPCQVVGRDVAMDFQRNADAQPLTAAHLESPSTDNSCNPPDGLCAGNGNSESPVSLSEDGGVVGYDSLASDLISVDSNSGGAQHGVDAFARTLTPTVTATAPAFPPTAVGDDVTGNVVVKNTGFGPASIGDSSISGANAGDFTVEGNNCLTFVSPPSPPLPLLRDGQTCTVTVDFAPVATGHRTATVTVKSYPDPGTTLASTTIEGDASENPPTTLAPGDTTRTSVRNTGGQTNSGGVESMVSGNGRWDVFVSHDDLGAFANEGRQNVFVRDLANPQHTVQISLGNGHLPALATSPSKPDGSVPNGDSELPSISADGRFVTFITKATNIVPHEVGDNPERPVVVCDRDPSNAKDAQGNPILDRPQPNTALPDFACFSAPRATPTEKTVDEVRPSVSADGTRLAWVVSATTGGQNQYVESYVATLSTPGGKLHRPNNVTPILIQTSAPGLSAFSGEQDSGGASAVGLEVTNPVLNANGSKVVYAASSGDVAIIENDLTGASQTSIRLDVSPAASDAYLGGSDTPVSDPAVDGSGNVAAFTYSEGPGDSVYVARVSGTTVTTSLQSINNNVHPGHGSKPALSGDGRYLAFMTDSLNMHNGVDQPATSAQRCLGKDGAANTTYCQVVAKDLVRKTGNQLVSASIGGDCPSGTPAGASCAGLGNSAPAFSNNNEFGFGDTRISLDSNGSEIGFDSEANDLVTADTNKIGSKNVADAFVHTWRSTLTGTVPGFGSVLLGHHKDRSATLTANGFGPVSPTGPILTGVNSGDFSELSSTCTGKTMHDSDTCVLKLRFTPTAVGARAGNVSMNTAQNGYPRRDPIYNQLLTGTGKKSKTPPHHTPGTLSTNPTSIDFGTVLPVAPGKSHTVTVTNTGGQPVTVTTITVVDGTVPGTHGDYTIHNDGCTGTNLAPGRTCTFNVVLVGHAVGSRPAVLTITDGSGGVVKIGLTARVATPTLLANPGVAVPGHLTAITGTGFAPNRQVDIVLTPFGETVQGNSNSHGTVTATLVLYSKVGTGPGVVTGHSHGLDPSISAKTPLLVVLGSIQGPILVTRH